MSELKPIPLSELLVDVENPRLDEIQANQRDSIRAVISNNPKKCLSLCRDIVNNRLNPAENLIVVPHPEDGSLYIVLEGNRRICSLKILGNPDIVLDLLPTSQSSVLRKLSQDFHQKPISSISCFIVNDRQEAEHWIELRHTGENDGAGLVPWGAAETSRFRTRSGIKEPHIQILDYMEKQGLIERDLRQKVPVTSMKRLIGDPYVKEKLGLSIDFQGKVESKYTDKELAKALIRIVNDLSTGKIRVKDIYYKDDRAEYIDSFSQNDLPNPDELLSEAHSLGEIIGGTVSEPAGKQAGQKKSRPSSRNRKNLVPPGFILQISKQRINNIYHELKHLNIEEFPNAVSVLLRVFLELTIDDYIERNTIPAPSNLNGRIENWKLKDKMETVANHLFNAGKLNKDQLNAIKALATSGTDILASISLIHKYIHNSTISPSPGDLKASWDTLEVFIQKNWD